MMLNKKGMSPLLLTIILIAFAVALGAMIMSWGSNKVYPAKSSCEDAEIIVQKAFDNDMLCFNEASGKLRIVVKNTGQTALSGIMYRKISPDMSVRDITLPSSALAIGSIYTAEIAHQQGERVHIEIIPKIELEGQAVICDDKAIIKESISTCILS